MDINTLHKTAREGDKFSEEKLFEALAVRFRHFVHQRIWDDEDGQDIVQNAMLIIAAEYKKIEVETSFSAWAYKVLENRILSYIKSRKSRAGRMEPLPDTSLEIAGSEVDPTLESRLLDCIGKVAGTNRRYARVLNLHYQGYTTAEVCEKLKMSPNHSYVALSRARSMLEQCLEKGVIE